MRRHEASQPAQSCRQAGPTSAATTAIATVGAAVPVRRWRRAAATGARWRRSVALSAAATAAAAAGVWRRRGFSVSLHLLLLLLLPLVLCAAILEPDFDLEESEEKTHYNPWLKKIIFITYGISQSPNTNKPYCWALQLSIMAVHARSIFLLFLTSSVWFSASIYKLLSHKLLCVPIRDECTTYILRHVFFCYPPFLQILSYLSTLVLSVSTTKTYIRTLQYYNAHTLKGGLFAISSQLNTDVYMFIHMHVR